MEYKEPTYEEYKKATEFAKFRYKFGIYVQIIAFLLLIILFVYAFVNVEEMKANPIDYAEKKLGVKCSYPLTFPDYELEVYNGSNRNFDHIKKEG